MRPYNIFFALAVGTVYSQGYDYPQPNMHQQMAYGSQFQVFPADQQQQYPTQSYLNGPAMSVVDQNQFVQHNQRQQYSSFDKSMDYSHSFNMMHEDQQNHHHHHQNNAPSPIITKHFYIHSAPEDDEDEIQEMQLNPLPARTHYRVLFINAPTQSSKSAALQLAQAQSEEKTVIYVLSKKPDLAELQENLHAVAPPTNKPEVFFIKYKTPEEAQHAQSEIQAQYDALGGTSDVSDEGVAPVHSFIGALEDSNQIEEVNSAFSSYGPPDYTAAASPDGGIAENNIYLPATY